MVLTTKLIAAVGLTTAAASAAAYWTITSQNAPPRSAPSADRRDAPVDPAAPIVGPDDVKLCVGGDRILRATPEDADECPAGQDELLLAWDSDEQVCDTCDPFADQPPPESSSDNATMDALERRIRELENAAYFEVVTKDDAPILRVRSSGLHLFNANGQAVAAIGRSDSGGYFTGRSATGGIAVSIGTSGDRAGVRVTEGDVSLLDLGKRDGPFGLRFPSSSGLIAGLGESRAGSGAIVVGTIGGALKASFTATDQRGMVAVVNQTPQGGVALTEALIGGGMFDLGDSSGNSVVKMGHNGHRYGIVMTGPVLGIPYVPRLGIPGGYFMGCASDQRPACEPVLP